MSLIIHERVDCSGNLAYAAVCSDTKAEWEPFWNRLIINDQSNIHNCIIAWNKGVRICNESWMKDKKASNFLLQFNAEAF